MTDGAGTPQDEVTSSAIWPFAILASCIASGYGVLFTVVGDYRDAYGISEGAIGFLIAIGFLTGFLSQILIAPLGDRGHATTLVFGGVVVNAIGLVLLGVGDDLVTLCAGRAISGLAAGAVQPSIRRIVIIGSGENLGRNLGRLTSAGVLGFAIGPAVSAVLVGPFGLSVPFFVIGAVSMVALGVAYSTGAFASGPAGAIVGGGSNAATAKDGRLALDLLRIQPFAGAVVLGGTVYLMIGGFDALWDVVHVDLGTDPWLANLGITLFALPLVVLAPIGGRIAQTRGPFGIAAAGLVLGALFLTSFGLVPSGGWIFTVAMIQGLTDGLTVASSGIAVAMTIPAERQAGAQGVLGAAQALSAGFMAFVSGALYAAFGRTVAYATVGATMLVLTAIGMALAREVWLGGRQRAGVTPLEGVNE